MMSTTNFRISSTTSSVGNGVLNLTIPVPNSNFYSYSINNISSQASTSILIAISDDTSNSYNGQPASTNLNLQITLANFGITTFPENKLQVLIYNEKPQNFNPANTLPQFIRLVENKKYNAWEDLCDGSFSISNNLQPDEGCGGILELS